MKDLFPFPPSSPSLSPFPFLSVCLSLSLFHFHFHPFSILGMLQRNARGYRRDSLQILDGWEEAWRGESPVNRPPRFRVVEPIPEDPVIISGFFPGGRILCQVGLIPFLFLFFDYLNAPGDAPLFRRIIQLLLLKDSRILGCRWLKNGGQKPRNGAAVKSKPGPNQVSPCHLRDVSAFLRFQGIQHFQRIQRFQESNVSRNPTFPGIRRFQESNVSRNPTFPGIRRFQESDVSRNATFPGNPTFPGILLGVWGREKEVVGKGEDSRSFESLAVG